MPARIHAVAFVVLLAAILVGAMILLGPVRLTAFGRQSCSASASVPYLLAPDGARLSLAVADTEAERERGLMNRASLTPDDGMLFAFPGPTDVGFWMRDTPIPLSVAWMSSDWTVIDVQDMAPETDTIHQSPKPYSFAVEANSGWFARNGVVAGSTVSLCGVTSTPGIG